MSARAVVIADTTVATIAVAFAAILFGTSGCMAQLYAPDAAPLSLACGRVIIGGTALVVIACLLGRAPWRDLASPKGALAASLAVVGFQVGFFAAVDRLGVAQATVLTIATGPIVAGLADHTRGVARLTTRWVCGAGLAVAGVACVCSGGWRADPSGLAAAMLAGCCFPLYGSALRSLAASGDHLRAVAAVFGGAVPLALLLCATPYAALPTAGEFGAVAYLGMVPTALAYLLWAQGLRHLTLRDTVLITMLEPATAVVLAIVALDAPATALTFVGLLLVVVGLGIAGRTRRPDPPILWLAASRA